MKVLILYSELAGYVLACIEALLKEEVSVLLIRWPVNEEAPFQFDFDEKLQIYDRSALSRSEMEDLTGNFNPDLVLVSGWIDKDYLSLARKMRKRGTPVVSGLDNQWTGSSRQRLATLASPYFIKRNFDLLWVTGDRQYEFARRLGFPPSAIRTGFYSADWGRFDRAYRQFHEAKFSSYPRKLLFVGRMVDFKGIGELCEGFLERAKESDWSLLLVGAGEYPIPDHPRIELRGFVQPDQLPLLTPEVGGFILPSHREPWGVVLHEFAAAGLPLLASEACGAGDAFIREGYNGYVFQTGSLSSLSLHLKALFDKSDKELWEMGQRSHGLSQQMTPEIWAQTLISLIRKFSPQYA